VNRNTSPTEYPESGTYQLLLEITPDITVSIRSLGDVSLPQGLYIYTGRATKYLYKRVCRHLRKEKKLHWHIDYLTTHPDVRIHSVNIVNQNPSDECRINKEVLSQPGTIVPVRKFGSSDCKNLCPAHLLKVVHFPGTEHIFHF